MQSLQAQFTSEILPDFFERDTHTEVQDLAIDSIHVLSGETAQEDIIVIRYQNSPNISFYDAKGQLIDVDHYLPENYQQEDESGADAVIANLRDLDHKNLNESIQLKSILEDIYKVGDGRLAPGLIGRIGLQTSARIVAAYAKSHQLEPTELKAFINRQFKNLKSFLQDYILFQQRTNNGYVHITPEDNIIITPLNKRCGMAVIIETQDVNGKLLSPNKWIITRTKDSTKFEQALVFRTEDVKNFFEADGFEESFTTDRYKLYHSPDQLSIDSLVDDTDNRLRVNLVNDCYQVLASDDNIIICLSNQTEVTLINTHRSVVPKKWPKKIVLPEAASWIRADENLSILFVQKSGGGINVLDITGDHPIFIADLGNYAAGFEIDQSGHLVVRASDKNQLLKIKTNVLDIELPSDARNFASVIKNLSHLFKGESLFTKTQFAKVVTEEKPKEKKKLPTAIEIARYDFETNIEHMLAKAGHDYEQLLEVQNKIAIARQNIAEELATYAEKEGIFLVGQRLQTTINSIVRPVEQKIRNLIESTRADRILSATKDHRENIPHLTNPDSYREMLNEIRKFEEELRVMLPENVANVLAEFKTIQQELNATFSDQIANDGTTLQRFISGEIEQIEAAIQETHDPRRLEILLSTHPAALELMTLLKQSYVLQNIAKEQKLSPAAIQSRLYDTVAKRKAELQAEVARKEAERNAAKLQLANMIQESIDFFVKNHSSNFSDLELSVNATHQQIQSDILKLERSFKDLRLANDLRRRLERRILERNRADLEKMVAFEGKYAFIQNDPDLYVDLESTIRQFPKWRLELLEKRGAADNYLVTFVRNTDRAVYRPSTTENLQSGKAFEITEADYEDFFGYYQQYQTKEYSYEMLEALWAIHSGEMKVSNYPQFSKQTLEALLPKDKVSRKALRCALEKKRREHLERTRPRYVPKISPEFIDDTPYFQEKLQEFIIKSKLQLVSGAGIILLSGPPSTGKSAFLKFAAAIMNREYFEHAADKWQTKNSLVTAIKFGEHGPYSTPAGFTKAITTPHSLINIEEIKEWPEALRKSLNPFFAGSTVFTAPDGTQYDIGADILLCAAANLGSMYRQDDEPFTADFWSRIEVVEYEYAPEAVDRAYYQRLHRPKKNSFLTMRDLVRDYFFYKDAPDNPKDKAVYFAQQFLEFILLPKADEKVKRENLQNHIRDFFNNYSSAEKINFGPEEAAKVALRRLKDFQAYSPKEFFDLYDHFINGKAIRSKKLGRLQSTDIEKYEHLRVLFLAIRYIEGCLRELRTLFYTTAGQTEVEGTNREFIKCVQLLGLLGKM